MALPTKIVQIYGHRLSAHWNGAIQSTMPAVMASITSLDGPLGPGLLLAGIQQSILALLECVMKFQVRPGLDDDANSGYPPWIQEQRPATRQHSLQSREIRCSAARSTVNEQWLLQR